MIVDCKNHAVNTLKSIRIWNITTEESDRKTMRGLPNANLDIGSMELVHAYEYWNHNTSSGTEAIRGEKFYDFELPVVVTITNKTESQVQTHITDFLTKLGYSFTAQDGSVVRATSESVSFIEAEGEAQDRIAAEINLIFQGRIIKTETVKKLPPQMIQSFTLDTP